MSIKKIILKNFQIYKQLELTLNPRFNVLVGPNDSGKSSIIRAINWVMYNEPSGNWMNRIDKKGNPRTTRVKIIFEDDTVIERIKGKGINKYIVDGEEFENFGYNVPIPVIEAIQIYPLQTNKASLNVNVAMQDERPFLIQESGPIKASVLDILTGNSLLQKAISDFNKDGVALSKEITVLENNIANCQQQLEVMPDIEKADNIIKEAESRRNILDEKLEPELSDLCDKQLDIQKYEIIISNYKEVDILKIYNLEKDLNDCFAIVKELSKTMDEYNDHKEKLKTIPDISDAITLQSKLENLIPALEDIEKYEIIIRDNENIIEEKKGLLTIYEKELATIYKENPNCPTCGNVWLPLDT